MIHLLDATGMSTICGINPAELSESGKTLIPSLATCGHCRMRHTFIVPYTSRLPVVPLDIGPTLITSEMTFLPRGEFHCEKIIFRSHRAGLVELVSSSTKGNKEHLPYRVSFYLPERYVFRLDVRMSGRDHESIYLRFANYPEGCAVQLKGRMIEGAGT